MTADNSAIHSVVVVGPGRAGGALALAAQRSGHRVGVVTGPSGRVPVGVEIFDGSYRPDLVFVATRDEMIASAVASLEFESPGVLAHLSGFTSVDVLAGCFDADTLIGSFHPLQTLPDPQTGALAFAGSFVALTGPAAKILWPFALSLGMHPFHLADESKPAYHAAASAASNFLVACLAVAGELLADAGVDFEVVRPLVESSVVNAFTLGPAAALTGPVARGDMETVRGQIEAAERAGLGSEYRHLVMAVAARAGRDLGEI